MRFATNECTFGQFVRQRREELGYGVRELAAKLKMSPAYLSDIEKGNRNAPLRFMKRLEELLQITEDERQGFEDLACASRDNLYADINPYLTDVPNARVALRTARDCRIPAHEWIEFARQMNEKYAAPDSTTNGAIRRKD